MEVPVTAVPIVVASTTDDYFVLYVRHELDDDTTVQVPVAVTLGEAGTTTLAENVAALPARRYRVEKYLVASPADVDGDCIDDIAELADPVGLNPVNSAPVISFTDGVGAIPDRQTFDTFSINGSFLKFVLLDMDTDTPGVHFINVNRHPVHNSFLDALARIIRGDPDSATGRRDGTGFGHRQRVVTSGRPVGRPQPRVAARLNGQ